MDVAFLKDSEITEARPEEWSSKIVSRICFRVKLAGSADAFALVVSVNMGRVIRNVLRFNTGKIVRFPQKSANWPIPISCFTAIGFSYYVSQSLVWWTHEKQASFYS